MPNTDTTTPANAGTASQYTPGPWFIANDGSVRAPYRGHQPGIGIAKMMCFGAHDVHMAKEANARLIAAAPDLLAALEAMLEIARGIEADTMGDDETVAICKGAAELVAWTKGVQS